MAQTTLYQILNQLPSLEPGELRQLNQAGQSQLIGPEETQKCEAFHPALLASGLLKQIKPPRRIQDLHRRFIDVHGKPVSETIIEERLVVENPNIHP